MNPKTPTREEAFSLLREYNKSEKTNGLQQALTDPLLKKAPACWALKFLISSGIPFRG